MAYESLQMAIMNPGFIVSFFCFDIHSAENKYSVFVCAFLCWHEHGIYLVLQQSLSQGVGGMAEAVRR